MNRSLLPLMGLRAFEATARHLSVSKAAEELSVTPGAVSQQVKHLEDSMGVALIRRKGRSIELTDAGLVLQLPLTKAFDMIALTLDTVSQRPASEDTLTLSLYPTLAEKWVMPRLAKFHHIHPGLDIQIMTTFRDTQFDVERVDLASYMGSAPPAGTDGIRLFDDEVLPVCSPKLRVGKRSLSKPADLLDATIIHSVRRADDWQRWLNGAGYGDLKLTRKLFFSTSTLAIQAAIDGMGVAMVQHEYVKDRLARGVLVAPFKYVAASGQGYYLVWPTTRRKSSVVSAAVDWIREEAATSISAK